MTLDEAQARIAALEAERDGAIAECAALRPLVVAFKEYGSCDQSCNYRRECICGWVKTLDRIVAVLAETGARAAAWRASVESAQHEATKRNINELTLAFIEGRAGYPSREIDVALAQRLASVGVDMLETFLLHLKGENKIASPEMTAAIAEHDAQVRAKASEALVHICATYGIKVSVREDGTHIESADPLRERLAEARAKALRDAAAHFRSVPHHVAAPDGDSGLVSFGHVAADVLDSMAIVEPTPNDVSSRIADAMERSKPRVAEALKLGRSMAGAEDPHSPALYRVGQTGAERALPVADAPAEKPFVELYAFVDPQAPVAKPEACATCNSGGVLGTGATCHDCGGTGRAS